VLSNVTVIVFFIQLPVMTSGYTFCLTETLSHPSTSTTTLVASTISYHLQTLSTHAQNTHKTSTILYLTDKVTATADLQSRAGLRSARTSKYHIPRIRIKFGERNFSCASLSAWNNLPQHIREITDTTRFKRHLKTVLFQRAFQDS